MIDAPIFHVNADDPEAVLRITELALDFRMQFGKDVVVDMVCFRKLDTTSRMSRWSPSLSCTATSTSIPVRAHAVCQTPG